MAQRRANLVDVLSRIIVWLFRPVIAVLAWLWAPFVNAGQVLMPTRASALTVGAGVLLLLTAQGQELAVRLRADGGAPMISWGYVWFLGGVLLFAFQAWYWARLALEFEDGAGHRGRGWAFVTFPRAYAGAAILMAVWAHYRADDVPHMVMTAVAGAIFVLLLIKRRSIFRWLGWSLSPVTRGDGRQARLRDLTSWNKAILYASVGCSLVILFLAIRNPVGLGQWMGGGGIVFLAFSQIVPVVSVALILGRSTRVPIVTTAFLVAAGSSLVNDNHEVQIVTPTDKPWNDPRPGVVQAALAWYGLQDEKPGVYRAKPMVFVSTAGGGLRAAYWTATVLGALEDRCPGFSRSVFSISGVSGGSVGAAVYAAALRSAPQTGNVAACLEAAPDGPVSGLMQGALSADFLGPTFGAMFYPDLVQRFLPLPRKSGLQLPDRGGALAASWSRAWDDACTAAGAGSCLLRKGELEQPFLDVAGLPEASSGWRPVLLLNGTHQETGKRFIASNVRIKTEAFLDSFDMHAVLGGDVTLAMAALNSARFTYVSPAGRLLDANGNDRGHVLDGGYFENFGAVSSVEIAREAIRVLERANLPVRPIFIQISSDPELKGADLDLTNPPVWPEPEKKAPFAFLNEIAGPVRGLMSTREARGILASKTLDDILADHENYRFRFPTVVQPVTVDFRMCNPKDKAPPPLGWLMSKGTEAVIRSMLTDAEACQDNIDALRDVMEAVSRPLDVTCRNLGVGQQQLCEPRAEMSRYDPPEGFLP